MLLVLISYLTPSSKKSGWLENKYNILSLYNWHSKNNKAFTSAKRFSNEKFHLALKRNLNNNSPQY